MSSTKRKKKRRNLRIRLWVSILLILASLGIFIYAIYDVVFNGLNEMTIRLGLGMLVLFFGAGYFVSPVMKRWHEGKKI